MQIIADISDISRCVIRLFPSEMARSHRAITAIKSAANAAAQVRAALKNDQKNTKKLQ
jgi:hypothetical protein